MTRYLRLVRNITNWWVHFGVKAGLLRQDPLVFRTRGNVVVEVPRRLLHEFKEIFMVECYTRDLGHPVAPRPVVIDVGTRAG